jgi:hypothetical protein
VPGDPKECRRHAARCAELAVAARAPELKSALLGLSKNWENLALSLEDIQGVLDEIEVIGADFKQAIDTSKRLSSSSSSKS